MTLKEKALKIWGALRPDQKKKLGYAAVVIGIVILSLALYKSNPKTSAPPKAKAEKKRELGIDKSSVLEKSHYNEAQQSVTRLQKEVDEMKEKLEEKQKDKEPGDAPSPDRAEKPSLAKAAQQPTQIKNQRAQQKPSGTVPPPPAPGAVGLPQGVPPAPGGPAVPVAQSKPEVFGDIEIASQRSDGADKKEGKKKEKLTVYLPPSFMEATLLSGMYAPTATGGSSSPLPVLIRIKHLAVLPNHVKGNLKGCFLIGEAKGSLADERAHVRLNTLSCLAKGGESVIDQKIKGYAVDSDGFVGLRGNVVSKMGAAIARSLLAGFVAGFGDAVNTSTITTTTSGLGTTQTIDTDKAAKAGFGKGISQAAHDLQKFLLDLGKQAVPVIEIGAMKHITVVISEGVELEVKDRPGTCMGGGTKCLR